MKVLAQRVMQAQVSVDQKVIGRISRGLLLFVGFGLTDTVVQVDYLAQKILRSRIFEDENGKTNLAITDVEGEILSISQFTLYANTKKGNRPSFVEALAPTKAQKLYEDFNQQLRQSNLTVQTGQFGADMQVQLINDGPMTIMYEKENNDV
ncbi:D-aminoacyl-tRNA deacylase [Bombilactobacillus folatiphilus]|uniref:D-aminoacyl-tRNA deacylase n=1 Tax=Bombilactobacillus folatiphilus TaxID=2923362 RepID=A0ABY4P7L5_9LACO|nr:D-aminoacyl-tRNA deacylase [Bombilactobacillus folatiphilus]UQS81541.1 D-aminoacyl-tRNA deacylase [Bombilactobacillus folatiphilus]